MNGADLVVKALLEQEVRHVFGVLGDTTAPILDALYDYSDAIRYTTARHEQVAATMADGYGRVANRPGVVLNHVGPGVCNTVLSLAAAMKDSTPLVALTGAHAQWKLGRDAWQEIDQVGLLAKVTKWNTRIRRQDQIVRVLREAFVRAQTGRMGPVHVDIPKDISGLDLIEGETPAESAKMAPLREVSRALPNPLLVDQALDLLLSAARPVILAGGGVLRSEASAELIEFAELSGIPVITTAMGRSALPDDHDLYIGTAGHYGTITGTQVLADADVIFGIGTRFSDITTFDWQVISPTAQIVHVDVDPAEIGRQYVPAVGIVADARGALAALSSALRGRRDQLEIDAERLAELRARRDLELADFMGTRDEQIIKPQQVAAMVTRLMDRSSIVVVGSGTHGHSGKRVPVYQPRHWLRSMALGAMGWALPAAMGAKVARPECPVICLVGDGDFAQVMQDFETCVRERINVLVVVFNDNAFGALKQFQKGRYGGRFIGSDYTNIPFDQYARLHGADGWRVEKPSELGPAMEQAFRVEGPAIVDVLIDPFEIPASAPQAGPFVFSVGRR